MIEYIKALLAMLFDKPAVLRVLLTQLAAWLKEAAEKTETKVDDLLVQVLTVILENDDLWELVVPLLPLIFSVEVDEEVPVDENEAIKAVAARVSEASGLDVADVHGALLSLGK